MSFLFRERCPVAVTPKGDADWYSPGLGGSRTKSFFSTAATGGDMAPPQDRFLKFDYSTTLFPTPNMVVMANISSRAFVDVSGSFPTHSAVQQSSLESRSSGGATSPPLTVVRTVALEPTSHRAHYYLGLLNTFQFSTAQLVEEQDVTSGRLRAIHCHLICDT